jgi:dihydroorotate dehydrogenase
LQGAAFLDDLLARVLEARAEAAPAAKILLKIAPDLDDIQLDDIVRIARKHGIDGMIVANTTIARPDFLQDKALAKETGGLSGRPLFRPATIMLAKTYQRVEGAFPLIGVGGIASGEDALAKIAAGATLIQLYTALIYRGPGLIGEIKAALLAALAREGISNLAGLVGRDADDWAAGKR